jgi:transcriptional regulator with XRE-family HTH domain
MSAAETVSRNVRRLRRARGWTQTEAGQRFAAIAGCVPWSVAVWSAAEASGRVRQRSWTADELAVLAELFRVPVGDLFDPQPPCPVCGDRPPVGFSCNSCGSAGGAS